jgi:hypothetical protein
LKLSLNDKRGRNCEDFNSNLFFSLIGFDKEKEPRKKEKRQRFQRFRVPGLRRFRDSEFQR